jgi:hypothetical protein|tara:strand:- start:88 stop:237 length:150 start_codon:yes stop_codon:yes gene_type:complete
MKTFKLVTKTTKETINKVEIDNLGGAIEYFAKIKNLTADMLLSIYDVTT